jgi:hypothetical protein
MADVKSLKKARRTESNDISDILALDTFPLQSQENLHIFEKKIEDEAIQVQVVSISATFGNGLPY